MTETTAPARWFAAMKHADTWDDRPNLNGVHRVPGTDWLCATDGQVMVAQIGAAEGEDAPAHLKPAAHWLDITGEPAGRWPVAACREWAGEPGWPVLRTVECGWCDGKGTWAHDCDCDQCTVVGEESCEDCNGKGKVVGGVEPETRRLVFRNQVINAALIARVFAVLPDNATVSLYPNNNPHEMLRGVAGDVRFLIMPMRTRDEDPAPSEPAAADMAVAAEEVTE